MKNKKVRYRGDDYTILYDYQNGRYEIKSVRNPLMVLLVIEQELCRI